VGPDLILRDNKSCLKHIRMLQDCLDLGTIDRIERPPKNPDFSSLQHGWDMHQRTISAGLPVHITHRELLDTLREEWGHLDQQRITQLIQSIPQ